jgi:hypothetical protein
MLHRFHGNKCVFCGVSLAVSGYSESCPAREDEEPAKVKPRGTRDASAAHRVCYRCGEAVVPKIVRETTTTGYVDTPIAGHHVLRPIENTRLAAECPKCGVAMYDKEVEQANAQEDSDNVMGLLIVFGGLGLFVLVINWIAA